MIDDPADPPTGDNPPRDVRRAARIGGLGVVSIAAVAGALALIGPGGPAADGDPALASPSAAGVIATATAVATAEAPTAPTPTATPALTPSPTPGATEQPSVPTVPAVERLLVPVDSITDGDTIRVFIDGASEPVRIIGLDSPESRAPGTPIECMALEATAAAERLIGPEATVGLAEDPTQDTRDRYDRLLAHVFLADGRLFSEEMIRGGYAIHYVYDGIPSVHADRLAAAQAEAEAAERGLWDPDLCAGDPHAPSPAT